MVNEKTLILRNSVNDYFFSLIAQDNNVHSIYENRVDYYTFNIFTKMNISYPLLLLGWKRTIKKYDKVIIFDYGWTKDITKYIKRHNANCKIHLFFFNTISNKNHYSMLEDRNIDEFWTFDPKDAERYHINFNSPMYTRKVITSLNQKKGESNDVVFVGSAKNREPIINYVYEECRKRYLKLDFNVIKNPNDYISYSDYLRKIADSKCILDITNEGQTGLTLRFMESLFLSKKIITNNPEVKKYSFYNPHNIFVLGEDNINCINDFVSSPYFAVDPKEIDYYEIDNWIDRFK